MKHTLKTIPLALAALMAVGSLAVVSCDKENDVINPQTEQVAPSTKTLQFQINERFNDSMGRSWSIRGTGQWLNVNGGRNGVYLEVKFRERSGDRTYYYKGKAVWDFSCRPGQFTLIPDGCEEPTRLVWFVMREFTEHLLYD